MDIKDFEAIIEFLKNDENKRKLYEFLTLIFDKPHCIPVMDILLNQTLEAYERGKNIEEARWLLVSEIREKLKEKIGLELDHATIMNAAEKLVNVNILCSIDLRQNFSRLSKKIKEYKKKRKRGFRSAKCYRINVMCLYLLDGVRKFLNYKEKDIPS